MKSIEVKGTARTIAERSSEQARALKAIRKNNGVPCVLYGAGENVHFTVPAEGLRNLVYTPHIYVVDLVIDGKKVNAIMKDIQFHPVKDTILHVDFYQIDEASLSLWKFRYRWKVWQKVLRPVVSWYSRCVS